MTIVDPLKFLVALVIFNVFLMGFCGVPIPQEYENKWVIVLLLTSNKGGLDFQKRENQNGKQLFTEILALEINPKIISENYTVLALLLLSLFMLP